MQIEQFDYDWSNLEILNEGPDNTLYLIDDGWRKLILRLSKLSSKTIEDLKDEVQINQFLIQNNFPTSEILKIGLGPQKQPAALMTYLPGSTLSLKPGTDINLTTVRQAGQTLALLHQLTFSQAQKMRQTHTSELTVPPIKKIYQQQQVIKLKNDQLSAYQAVKIYNQTQNLTKTDWRQAQNSAHIYQDGFLAPIQKLLSNAQLFLRYYPRDQIFLTQCQQLVADLNYNQNDYCLIHNDFRPENTVINPQTNQLVGLIDFDYAAYGPRLKDVAQATLNWSFPAHTQQPIARLFYAFLNAYHQNLSTHLQQSLTQKINWWFKLATLIDAALDFLQVINGPHYKTWSIYDSSSYQRYLTFTSKLD